MDVSEKIIVALDVDGVKARRLAGQLRGKASWLKVGMTLFYTAGPTIVTEFKDMGFKVFVDLKLHDIPHQANMAAQMITELGADMLTTHASGGLAMLRAVREGAGKGYVNREMGAGLAGRKFERTPPICLAVTVLTSLDASALAEVGIPDAPANQVLRMARLAQDAMDGIVCSPQETSMVRKELGDDFVLVTPGVRPAGSEQGDQARVATPKQALEAGSDYLVIGRPITRATDPVAAFSDIAETML